MFKDWVKDMFIATVSNSYSTTSPEWLIILS